MSSRRISSAVKRNAIPAMPLPSRAITNEVCGNCGGINAGTYRPSRSIAFIINKPVKREIFAADFRDRVVHHLIAHRLVPLLEEKFIDDSYSTRKGKGTLYGIERVEEHIRLCSENYTRDCYILKIDIRSFFMKISKRRLYDLTEELLHERYGGNDLGDTALSAP